MPLPTRPRVTSTPLWAALSRVGITDEHWRELPAIARRAVIAAGVGLVLLVVLAPIFGFDSTAIGAYTAASLASTQFAGATASGNPKRFFSLGSIGVDKSIGGIHLSIWLLLILAGIVTSLIGMAIGLPTLRLRGDYLAIVTLGFG